MIYIYKQHGDLGQSHRDLDYLYTKAESIMNKVEA